VAAAFQRVQADVVVAGIDSDRLYPLHLQEEIAELLPRHPKLHVVASMYGHDAFLVEAEAVGRIITEALA
jgi:homoserine O-acetyltransferase